MSDPEQGEIFARPITPTVTHVCYWHGCKVSIALNLLMCKQHWMRVPYAMRKEVWRTYEAGQEHTLQCSEEYAKILRTISEWVRQHGR